MPSYNKIYDTTTTECIVWQVFTDCFCADNQIEYTHYKWVHDNFIKIKCLDKKYTWEKVRKIVEFIKTLNKEVSVILNIDRSHIYEENETNYILATCMLAEFGNTNCEVKFKDEKPTKNI